MRAVMVCVEYDDLLAVTLPYNRDRFTDVLVVTTPSDVPRLTPLLREHKVKYFATDLFYKDGARFNKWLALEAALDAFGREGWLCLMDADVCWPKSVRLSYTEHDHLRISGPLGPELIVRRGELCSPLRRMIPTEAVRGFFRTGDVRAIGDATATIVSGDEGIPPESTWSRWPVHRNVAEWAGYSQMFHCGDSALGQPPWHQVDWTHAGGADSFFQAKWAPRNKVRPPFEVLHVGEAGLNWFGRATPRIDGTAGADDAKLAMVDKLWRVRRDRERQAREGRLQGDIFDPEKV